MVHDLPVFSLMDHQPRLLRQPKRRQGLPGLRTIKVTVPLSSYIQISSESCSAKALEMEQAVPLLTRTRRPPRKGRKRIGRPGEDSDTEVCQYSVDVYIDCIFTVPLLRLCVLA